MCTLIIIYYKITDTRNSELYSPWTDPKENTSPIPLLLGEVITGTDHKENAGRFHCVA
jgi:hypothetical protein